MAESVNVALGKAAGAVKNRINNHGLRLRLACLFCYSYYVPSLALCQYNNQIIFCFAAAASATA
jgi:hypothetical protein